MKLMDQFLSHRRKIAALSLAVGMLLGLPGYAVIAQAQDDKPVGQDAASPEQLRYAFALSDAFKQVSKDVGNAVVFINTRSVITTQGRAAPLPDDPFFREFFGEEFRVQPQPREMRGQGSGVIVRQDGYIVTNNHVVQGATEIAVHLSGDREGVTYSAEIVGTDPETDLAVIRIEGDNFPYARFGNSEKLEVGDWVLAIGAPFGLERTVTAGIVSAKGRQPNIIRDAATNTQGYEDFIQTDAAINPGNSGGPLVNLYGEIVGINTAISTRTGAYNGVGFAIPSDMAKSVFDRIVEFGQVDRGWLGVSMQELDDETAESLQFAGRGVLIAHVLPGGPAEQAGLKAEDIITGVGDRDVTNSNDVMRAIARHAPNEEINVRIFRDGEADTIRVTLGDRREQLAVIAERGVPSRDAATSEAFGISVFSVTREIANQLGFAGARGVVITRVEEDGAGARVGLAPRDVILRINDHDIANVADFRNVMEQADLRQGVRMHVFSQGNHRIVFIRDSR